MKSIFDSSFKYKPSFDTDLRQTFLESGRSSRRRFGGGACGSSKRPAGKRRFLKRSQILREEAPEAALPHKPASAGFCFSARHHQDIDDAEVPVAKSTKIMSCLTARALLPMSGPPS